MSGRSLHHGDGVASGDVVIAKICACEGCKRRADLDTDTSYCFSHISSVRGGTERIFFVPRPLAGAWYTLDQVNEIEKALNGFDLELLPLDPNLMN